MVLQVNDLVLREVNAEIAKLSICELSGHFFHENFTDFDRVFGVSDENGTYSDQESYVLDPKFTLTCIALRRKVQVYLFITQSLGSIKLDRVISETRYSDLGKGATNSSLIDIDFAITSASEHHNVNIYLQTEVRKCVRLQLKKPPLILF